MPLVLFVGLRCRSWMGALLPLLRSSVCCRWPDCSVRRSFLLLPLRRCVYRAVCLLVCRSALVCFVSFRFILFFVRCDSLISLRCLTYVDLLVVGRFVRRSSCVCYRCCSVIVLVRCCYSFLIAVLFVVLLLAVRFTVTGWFCLVPFSFSR